MTRYLAPYATILLTFLIIDAIWLGLITKSFYANQLGPLLRESPNLAIAALFYLVYAVAILVLAVKPGIAANSIGVALGYGALLGFAAYGTYDITNLATIKGWPWQVTVVDLLWGTVITAVTAAAGFLAGR